MNKNNAKRETIIILSIIAVLLLTFWAWAVYSKPQKIPKKNLTRIKNLANGIFAIRGHMKHLNRKYAKSLAKISLDVTAKESYSWLTPEELLGLAANESDFRYWIKLGKGCRADCGITQVRLCLWRKSWKSCRKFCVRLSKDPALSFRFTAKELTRYKNRYCRRYKLGTWKFRRCIYNIYNQGPFYARKEKCKGSWKCLWLSRYYLRHECFTTGIRLQKRSRWSCRKAKSAKWIKRAYNDR